MAYVINPGPIPTVPVHGGGQFPVRRIYCVGRNYVEHAQEMGHSGREPPFFFTKPGDTVVPVPEGETGRIAYPSLTKNFHHEIELVVALAKGGRDIRASDAVGLIWGYAVGLDMTRRDLQNEAKKQGRPWCSSKPSTKRRHRAATLDQGTGSHRVDHAQGQRPAQAEG
jgi:fumarylpyruvate hydrolase